MNRAAADLHSHCEHGLVDLRAVEPLAAEGRDQRGVDVDHAALVVRRDLEERQETGQNHQVGLAVADRFEDRRAEFRLRPGVVIGQGQRNARGLGPGDGPDPRPARHDLDDLGLQPPRSDPVDQVLKRGSLARNAHRQSDRRTDDRRIARCFAHGAKISRGRIRPY